MGLETDIKFLLGAPVVGVEITDEQIKVLLIHAEEEYLFYKDLSPRSNGRLDQMRNMWIKLYTIALAKELLATIRGKFNQLPIADTSNAMFFGWREMYMQANTDKNQLKEILLLNK